MIQYIDDSRAKISSNSIVRTLVDHSDDDDKMEIENLLAGGNIRVQIHEDITYGEIYDSRNSLWNFMYFTSYFRKMSEWMEGPSIYAELAIPNKEVQYIFEEKVQKGFREKLKGRDMTPFYTAFVNKDCVALENEINDIFLS